MDDPYTLTPDVLADGVSACMPEMREIAASQWSMQQLRSHSGTFFLAGLDDNLKAYRRGHANGYRHLCEALALRIAILHREGVKNVTFCGLDFNDGVPDDTHAAFSEFEDDYSRWARGVS